MNILVNSSNRYLPHQLVEFTNHGQVGIGVYEKGVDEGVDENSIGKTQYTSHRSSLRLKLETKHKRFTFPSERKFRKYSRFSSSIHKRVFCNTLYSFPKQSNVELTANTRSTAFRNPATESHTKNFKSIALTSSMSFVCGAMFSILLLIYTQLDINRSSLQTTFPVDLILTVILVYFLGGALKGLAGLGMALISVPVIGLLYDPVLAAIIVALPLIVSNVRQGLFGGNLNFTVRNYNPFLITMCVAMCPTVYFSTLLPATTVSVLLGILSITYALMSLGFKLPSIPNSKDYSAQIFFGAAAGFAGGISGLIAIPLAIYVISRNIEKLIATSLMGLAFLISGLALFVGHLSNGNLTYQLLLLSVVATLPGLVGTFVGEIFRNRVKTQVFRKIVLIVVLAIGIKILLTQYIE